MSVQVTLDELEEELRNCEALRLHALENITEKPTRALVYESIILRATRAHENFIERVFLSYLLGEPTVEGYVVPCFASPIDQNHARKLVSSSASSRFLDWSEATEIRARCDVFFEKESPIYTATVLKAAELSWVKKIRNQAAHDSLESRLAFSKVLKDLLLVLPPTEPPAGEFLQMVPSKGPVKGREVLAFFLDSFRDFAQVASGKQG